MVLVLVPQLLVQRSVLLLARVVLVVVVGGGGPERRHVDAVLAAVVAVAVVVVVVAVVVVVVAAFEMTKAACLVAHVHARTRRRAGEPFGSAAHPARGVHADVLLASVRAQSEKRSP